MALFSYLLVALFFCNHEYATSATQDSRKISQLEEKRKILKINKKLQKVDILDENRASLEIERIESRLGLLANADVWDNEHKSSSLITQKILIHQLINEDHFLANDIEFQGKDALRHAIEHQDHKLAKLILKNIKPPGTFIASLFSPSVFDIAFEKDDKKCMKVLLKYYPPVWISKPSPYYCARSTGMVSLINDQKKFKVLKKSPEEILHYALQADQDASIFRRFLYQSKILNIQDRKIVLNLLAKKWPDYILHDAFPLFLAKTRLIMEYKEQHPE